MVRIKIILIGNIIFFLKDCYLKKKCNLIELFLKIRPSENGRNDSMMEIN